MPECFIRGSVVKYLRIPDEVCDHCMQERGAFGGEEEEGLEGRKEEGLEGRKRRVWRRGRGGLEGRKEEGLEGRKRRVWRGGKRRVWRGERQIEIEAKIV